MRWAPSPALGRAVIAAVAALVLTVLTRRVELLVVAAPFVLLAARGALTRPAPVDVRRGLSTRRLTAGRRTRLSVQAAPGVVTTAAVLAPEDIALDPPFGVVAGDGSASVWLQPSRWGRQQVTLPATWLSDPSGSWWHPVPRETLSFTVSPAVDSSRGSDAVAHPIGLVGAHASRRRGDGVELADIRPFRAGDRLQRINWRVSSRTGELHTNVTTAERDTDVLLLLDSRTDVGAGPTSPSSLDLGVGAAAAIAQHYLRLGDRVALHDNGVVVGSVPPGTGPRQRARLVEQLARARPDARSTASPRPVGRLRSGTLVFCCTPLLTPNSIEEVLRLVHRGASVVVIDTFPAELGRLERPPRFARRERRFWAEAWAIRRLQRDADVHRLAALGVPVVAWDGLRSLTAVVDALARQRTAPRLARR